MSSDLKQEVFSRQATILRNFLASWERQIAIQGMRNDQSQDVDWTVHLGKVSDECYAMLRDAMIRYYLFSLYYYYSLY